MRCGLLIILIVSGFIFSALSCSKSPTGPDGFKDPRTYQWTIDTLAYPGSIQTNMRSIWGSSANDVYVVGNNDQPGPGTMFHFDGHSWKTTKFHITEGGSISGAVALTSVYGFSPSNVWVAGLEYIQPPGLGYSVDSSLVIHYDGNKWQEISLPARGRMLQSIGGANPNDVWAGGVNTLYHSKGIMFTRFPAYIAPQGTNFSFLAPLSASEVYYSAYRPDVVDPVDSSFYYLFRYNGTVWEILDSTLQGTSQEHFGPQIEQINGRMYSAGGGVWQWTGSGWNKLFNNGWIYHVGGSSDNNLFACGGLSSLYHYNGTDWKEISLPLNKDVAFYSVWTNGVEVFIVGNDGSRTYIVHGK